MTWLHINILKLKAVLFVLWQFHYHPDSDKRGLRQVLSVTLLVQKFYQLCQKKSVTSYPHNFQARWILLQMPYKGTLWFQGIGKSSLRTEQKFCFTSPRSRRIKRHCPLCYPTYFVSPFAHPVTTWMDVWMQEENGWNEVYLFLPYPKVPKLWPD